MKACRLYIFNVFRLYDEPGYDERRRKLEKQVSVVAPDETMAWEYAKMLYLDGEPNLELLSLGQMVTS